MTITGSFLIIQDLMAVSQGAGSQLFEGEPIYAYCDDVSLDGKNNNTGKPRTMTDLTMADDANLNAHWNRRKGFMQFVSSEPLIINVKGRWVNSLGSVNNLGSVLTPYKVMRFGVSGHELYVRGTRVLDNIIAGENETVGSFYDSGSGIPVVIETWSCNANPRIENEVIWNIVFKEDRR